MDQDDLLAYDTLEKLYTRAIDADCDLVIGVAVKFLNKCTKENISPLYHLSNSNWPKVFSYSELGIFFFDSQEFCTPWAKLFRTSVWINNHIEFPIDIQPAEDTVICIAFGLVAKRMSIIKDVIYFWRTHQANVGRQRRLSSAISMFKAIEIIEHKLATYNILDKYYSCFWKQSYKLLKFGFKRVPFSHYIEYGLSAKFKLLQIDISKIDKELFGIDLYSNMLILRDITIIKLLWEFIIIYTIEQYRSIKHQRTLHSHF
jgi:hypothetical protein